MFVALSFLLFALNVFILASANGNNSSVNANTVAVSPTTTVEVPTSTAAAPVNTATPQGSNASHVVKTSYVVTATHVAQEDSSQQTSVNSLSVNPTATTAGKDAVSSTPTAQPSTEVKIKYYVNITLSDNTWSEDYLNDSSQTYKNLERGLINEFNKVFNKTNFNLTKISVTGFHNQSDLVMAKITLQFGKAPETEPKDPLQEFNEIKEEKKIGSYKLDKAEVKEHIPGNADITSAWEATKTDCCEKCNGKGGQVKQTRNCEGNGCDEHVMTMRYVKCSDVCKDQCSAGSRLVSSTNLFAAALLSTFLATVMTV